jgi:hypothetical protein
MRSVSVEQLLLFLFVLLLPLLNLLGRWLRRRPHEQAGGGPRPDAREEWPPMARVPERHAGRAEGPDAVPRVRRTPPDVPREGPRATRPVPGPRRRGRRRPLAGREGATHAIIAMTILGPCRGLEEPVRTADPRASSAPPGRP